MNIASQNQLSEVSGRVGAELNSPKVTINAGTAQNSTRHCLDSFGRADAISPVHVVHGVGAESDPTFEA